MFREKMMGRVLRYERWWVYLALPALSILMHWSIWGMDLQGMHVWRQTQTQQTIDAYVEEDLNILNPRILHRGSGEGISRLEFPLYQWLAALMGKLTGGGVWVSRLLSFLLGWMGIWGVYLLLGIMFRKPGLALIGAFFMSFSPVWYYYMVCPIPDVLALSLGIWGMYFLMKVQDGFAWGGVAGMAACFGLATSVKLSYAMFYAAAAIWWIRLWMDGKERSWAIIAGTCGIMMLSLGPALGWYMTVIPEWGASGVTRGVFDGLADWESLPGILFYHLWQMYPRTLVSLPMVPFIFWGIVTAWQWFRKEAGARSKAWPWLALMAVFFLFYAYEIFIIRENHDYYLFPVVPILVMLAALGAWAAFNVRFPAVKVMAAVLVLAVPVMTYRRIHPRWQDQNAEFNLDWAVHKQDLRKAVPEDALVVAGPDDSHAIVLYYIHKKGWSWDDNQGLAPEKMAQWIQDGAQYFYCDDRLYDQDSLIQPFLEQELGRFGSVRVYRLQDLEGNGK